MVRNKKIIVTSVIIICSLLGSHKTYAGLIYDDPTSPGGGGSTYCKYGDYHYDSSHLAWFKFTYNENVVGTKTTAYVSAQGAPLGKGGKPISIEKEGETCSQYSKTFYVSAYVPYFCGKEGEEAFRYALFKDGDPRNGYHYWNGVQYKGGILGFMIGSNHNMIGDSTVGYPVDGYPAVDARGAKIASGKTVKESEAEAAWKQAGGTGSASQHTWFCGGELNLTSREGYFKGTAKVELTDASEYTKVGEKEYVIEGTSEKTVKFKVSGTVTSDDEENKKVPVSADYLLYEKPPKWVLAATGDGGNGYLSSASSDRDAQITIKSSDGSKRICAVNEYNVHYKSIKGEGGWVKDNDGKEITNRVEDCITVTYQNAKTELGSISQMRLKDSKGENETNVISIEPATKNNLGQFGTGIDNAGLNTLTSYPETANVTVPAGYVNIWSMNKITKEKLLSNDDSDFVISGLIIKNPMNETGCGKMAKGSKYVDCYKSTSASKQIVFPQETRTFETSTSHPAEISASSITNSTQEFSKTTINAYAGPIKCSDFNKRIGMTDHWNYGRISYFGGDDGVSAGDLRDGSFVGSRTVWMKNPYDNLNLVYYGCLGYQVKEDRDGNGATQVYSVTNNKDAIMSPLYNLSANIPISTNSPLPDSNKISVHAGEIGNTWEKRLAAGYQFASETKTTSISNTQDNKKILGTTLVASMSWDHGEGDSSKSASLNIKIPYNYVVSVTTSAASEHLTAGDTPTFTASAIRVARRNAQVSSTGSYSSMMIKPTKVYVAKLVIDHDVDDEELEALQDGRYELGDKANGDALKATMDSALGGSKVKSISTVDYQSYGDVTASDKSARRRTNFYNKPSISFDTIEDDEAIGEKMCVAVAVYPSDSHNSDVSVLKSPYAPVNDNEQLSATDPDHYWDNAKTLISVSCSYVGKSPIMSVEGGSISASGTVVTGKTKYDNTRIFGSWSEYGVLSNETAVGNDSKGAFGSGASLAYANPVTGKNQNASPSQSGIGVHDTTIRYPQTVGNTSLTSTVGSTNESQKVADKVSYSDASAWLFASKLKMQLIKSTSGLDARVKILSSIPDDDDIEENKLYIVHSDNDISINDNIVNDKKNALVVIYSEKNINIDKSVDRIDATLIAEGNIDTCVGSVTIDGHTRQLKQGGDNYQLLIGCSEPLYINGAVASSSISLDRAYGGGSDEPDGDGTASLDVATLGKRAEIFSYDPRIVYWSYELAKNDQGSYQTTYIRELTPRL